jgi:hypothetical protein
MSHEEYLASTLLQELLASTLSQELLASSPSQDLLASSPSRELPREDTHVYSVFSSSGGVSDKETFRYYELFVTCAQEHLHCVLHENLYQMVVKSLNTIGIIQLCTRIFKV